MGEVDFDTLVSAAGDIVDAYDYQFQPRVDGDIVTDTCKSCGSSHHCTKCLDASDEAQFYQNRFNFSGPVVLSHGRREENGQAYSGVDTT